MFRSDALTIKSLRHTIATLPDDAIIMIDIEHEGRAIAYADYRMDGALVIEAAIEGVEEDPEQDDRADQERDARRDGICVQLKG